MCDGEARASAVGIERSRKTQPSSRPNRSTVTVPGSIPTTLGKSDYLVMQNAKCKMQRTQIASRMLPFALHRRSNVCDGLRVEDLIVLLEEPRNAGLVDLHLEVADPKRS